MKHLLNFFQINEEATFNQKDVDLIRDYFSDIIDHYNIREVKTGNDPNFAYPAWGYWNRNNAPSTFETLNRIDLSRSNMDGAFCINFDLIKYKLTIKYLRGHLKFPDFSDDISIFLNRLQEDRFSVSVIRGSEIKGIFSKKNDEIYMEIYIKK